MIVVGFFVYFCVVDWQKFRDIVDSVGVYLFVDMVYVVGFVVVGVYFLLINVVYVVIIIIYKILCGFCGGFIMCKLNFEFEKKFNLLIFFGIQGGLFMYVIVVKVVVFKEVMIVEFCVY